MKRILNTVILSMLLVCSCVQQMDAGLNQTIKNVAHYTLKKVGENPGWVAYAAITYGLYRYILEEENATEPEQKAKVLYRTLKGAIPLGAAAIALSAACNWWASKL